MKQSFSRFIPAILLSITVAVAGFFIAGLIAKGVDNRQRTQLEIHAKNAALLVNPADIKSLSGTTLDLENSAYQRIKNALTLFRENNPDIRFVYLMGYRSDIQKLFFYVDSEPPTSEDYSPPGQVFDETTESEIKGYFNAVPYTDGPSADRWGEWITGYAPIRDGNTGELVAELGIDIATRVWHEQINFIRFMITVIGILLAVLAFSLSAKFRQAKDSVHRLETANQKLKLEEAHLMKTQELAQVGRFIVYIPEQTVLIDALFAPLFQLQSDQKIAVADFLAKVHPDDLDSFVHFVEEMKTKSENYHSFDCRITTGDNQYRVYHIYGNVERSETGTAIRFAGIIQDVTDIASPEK